MEKGDLLFGREFGEIGVDCRGRESPQIDLLFG